MRRVRHRSRMAGWVVMAALMCLVLAGCGKSQGGGKPADAKGAVVIGAVLPLTGGIATYGQECKNGIELAVDEVNARGKVPMKVIFEDNKSEPSETNKAVVKLISLNNVNCIIGAVASSNTLAAVDEVQVRKVPMITPASTNVKVTAAGPYISRVCFIDPFQGFVMAKFARHELKAKTAVMMKDLKSDYSKGLAAEFLKTFEKLGGKVIDTVTFSAGDKDFSAALTKIQEENPDCVFLPAYYSEVGVILNQAATKGLTMPFLGGDGWDSPQLYELAGKGAAKGNYFSSHFAPDDKDPKVREFVKKYTERFKSKPGALAALGYDAVLVAEDACLRAKPRRGEALMKAIDSVKGLEGVTGLITIDENRNALKGAVILETRGDRAVFKVRVLPGGLRR